MYGKFVLFLIAVCFILTIILGPFGFIIALFVLGPISALTEIKDTFFYKDDSDDERWFNGYSAYFYRFIVFVFFESIWLCSNFIAFRFIYS